MALGRGSAFSAIYAAVPLLGRRSEVVSRSPRGAAFPATQGGMRTSAWYQRRIHAPCDLEVPPDCGLDSLYFRHVCEEEYGRQLRELVENPENNLMGNHSVCFPNHLCSLLLASTADGALGNICSKVNPRA
jgi:hypothetical protein